MLYAGLDLSRKRLDFHLLNAEGATVETGAAPPDAGGLRGLTERLDRHGEPIRAAIESMNGARFVHDRLELAGWQVEIADTHRRSRGWRRLPAKPTASTPGCWPSCRGAIWCRRSGCPTRVFRRERELARFRLHLVRHRTTLKNRIHATLIAFGHPCPVSDLFGLAGRELLDRVETPDPWPRNVDVSLELIDDLELQIA